MKLCYDKKAAISIAYLHDRAKRDRWTDILSREKLDCDMIWSPHVASQGQPADILTKGLSNRIFEKIVSKLYVTSWRRSCLVKVYKYLGQVSM